MLHSSLDLLEGQSVSKTVFGLVGIQVVNNMASTSLPTDIRVSLTTQKYFLYTLDTYS